MNNLLTIFLTTALAAAPSLLQAEESQKQQVDLSAPMAVYTGGAITGGNDGLGGAFQFGLHAGNWGLLGN